MELTVFYMMVILKVPVLLMIWLVFWASKSDSRENPPWSEGPGGSSDKDPEPDSPLSPVCQGRRWRASLDQMQRKRSRSDFKKEKVFQ